MCFYYQILTFLLVARRNSVEKLRHPSQKEAFCKIIM